VEPSLSLQAPAIPAAVPRVRAEIRRFVFEHCAADDQLLLDVALAVTEASANVVRHAYPAHPGPLIVSASVEAEALLVRVIDRGVGLFEPTTDPGLGLGMRMLRTTTQDLTIDSSPVAGTTVQLRFPCPPPHKARPPARGA
jgi:anti-sigma regulatory factor (Ser/Thr protein kinase)